MRDLLLLAIHLLVTLAKLLGPGGTRQVAAESLLLKHQLLISNRSRQRAPNLTMLDRLVLGLTTLFVSPHRIPKLSAILKPATLFEFHKTLVYRKYRLLFSPSRRKRKPGPKGPSTQLIAAIVEMRRRNPKFGCVRIAQQINYAFGIKIDKDVVRRVLATHCRPRAGCRWSVMANSHRSRQGQRLVGRFVPRRIDPPAEPLGDAGHGRLHSSNHWVRHRSRVH